MKCSFENGGEHSLDPWCGTHRRSASCCIQYANEALDAALLAGSQWTTEPPTDLGNDPKQLVERLRSHNEAIDRELADARAVGELLKDKLSATVGDFRLVLYGDTIIIVDTNREQRRRPGELPLHLCEQFCTELTRLASLGPLPENIRGLIQW